MKFIDVNLQPSTMELMGCDHRRACNPDLALHYFCLTRYIRQMRRAIWLSRIIWIDGTAHTNLTIAVLTLNFWYIPVRFHYHMVDVVQNTPKRRNIHGIFDAIDMLSTANDHFSENAYEFLQ